MKRLCEDFADVCKAYRDELNKMWETKGDWIADDFQMFEVADCIIGLDIVLLCVDNNVAWGTFYDWYNYDNQVHYGIEMNKKGARAINLNTWIKGFPEREKIAQSVLDEWEKEYWQIVKEDAKDISKKEAVNHPSHYNQYDVEVLEMMKRIWGEDAVKNFCKLNAFKYRMRAGHKDDVEQDLAKEKFYLDYFAQLKGLDEVPF